MEKATPGDLVYVYSNRFECELTVEITHRRKGKLGGNLVEAPDTLMLETGDHLHFRPGKVWRIDGGNEGKREGESEGS